MKKTFQKTLIAAALTAASIGAFAGTPGTTNLLFPYITTATGSYTFISIVSQKGTAANLAAAPLHFTYSMKATTAANSTACVHLDGDTTATKNDLIQFEVSNKVNVPTSSGDTTSVPKYYPTADRMGMLVVNNNDGSIYGSGATYTSAILYGEARLINTTTGLATGYSTDDLHAPAAAGSLIDFAAAGGPDNGTTLGQAKVLSWFPATAVSTSFYMIPMGSEATMAFAGNLSATYQVQDGTATQGAAGFGGHYNNNEGFQSSNATAPVTCVGVVDKATMLGADNAAWSNNGGWGNFRPTTAVGALIYKIESTSAVSGTQSFVTRAPVL